MLPAMIPRSRAQFRWVELRDTKENVTENEIPDGDTFGTFTDGPCDTIMLDDTLVWES